MAKCRSVRKASFFDEFFKVYLPEQSSQRLRVPPAFVKQINGTIPNNAVLKDLGGKLWHVEMEEAENGLYFKNGWQRFVSDHSLEFGNFLVFRYKGNSLFDVKIFGKNGCLKEEASANKCMNEETLTVEKTAVPVKIEKESEEDQTCSKSIRNCKRMYSEIGMKGFENSKVSVYNEVSRRKSQRIASKTIEQHGAFDASEFSIPTRPHFTASVHPAGMKRSEKSVVTGSNGASRRKSQRIASKTIEQDKAFDASKFVIPTSPHFIASVHPAGMKRSEKSVVTGSNGVSLRKSQGIASNTIEQHGAFNESKFVIPTNPHFIASFYPTTPFSVNIPSRWLSKNGIKMEPEMVLNDENGKLWPVKVASRLDGRIVLTKGWMDFWKGNSLVVDDKCLFEFTFGRGRKLSREIQVQILRARAQKLPSYPRRRRQVQL